MSIPMRKFVNVLLLAALVPCLVTAQEASDPRAEIAGLVPGLTAEDVRPSVVEGLYEVAIGSQIVYVTGDSRYLIKGDIVDLETNQSLTEARRSGLRLSEVEHLSDEQMVVFGPEDAAHTITVFTDIDCTYCRKLHREIDQINARNIRVRYVFYPRFGPGSESWAKADAVWCSQDRQSALTRAKSGEEVTADKCPTPVAEHYALGNKIGVRGTPAILMEDGELLPGYVPAAELAAYLDRT
jgi:thiol:disulfide interchange protein DsbC